MKKRVALYLRVSTTNGHQTTENQERELRAIRRAQWLGDCRHLR
jgi:hypothetical protein